MSPAAAADIVFVRPLLFSDDRHDLALDGASEGRSGADGGGEHAQGGARTPGAGAGAADRSFAAVHPWRQRERLRTAAVALVVCLNIGVDPPDAARGSPNSRATLQCFLDPSAQPAPKSLEAIGRALQAQYERWQPKARLRSALDPTADEVKRLCLSARRAARGERALFHYNGHGVPRPTANGEIWVFNRSFTEYIPLSVYDLQTWLGSPAILVADCSSAGRILRAYEQFAHQRWLDARGAPGAAAAAAAAAAQAAAQGGSGAPWVSPHDVGAQGRAAALRDSVVLAACGPEERLPDTPALPADVFTSCLTAPLRVALRWLLQRGLLRDDSRLPPDLADRVPGTPADRRSPLGELVWVLTAVTDSIAWSALPRPLFQRLFRQDLLVASLLRNFLLACRVMGAHGCRPRSSPALPPTEGHPLWDAWDLAAEACLAQVPALLENPETPFRPTGFFRDQLAAFELWLDRSAAGAPDPSGGADGRWTGLGPPPADCPPQLPVVLQILLSQQHRLKALVALARFADAGPGAVGHALAVGVFPYVLKLLQTSSGDLHEVLSFLWAKILACDPSCHADLLKDGGHLCFLRFLSSGTGSVGGSAPASVSEGGGGGGDGGGDGSGAAGTNGNPTPSGPVASPDARAMAVHCLAAMCDGRPRGQALCAGAGALGALLSALSDASVAADQGSPLFLKWTCLALGALWDGAPGVGAVALERGAAGRLLPLLGGQAPEVRACALAALAALVRPPGGGSGQSSSAREQPPPSSPTEATARPADADTAAAADALPDRAATERALALDAAGRAERDGSALVRGELALLIARVARGHPETMRPAAIAVAEALSGPDGAGEGGTTVALGVGASGWGPGAALAEELAAGGPGEGAQLVRIAARLALDPAPPVRRAAELALKASGLGWAREPNPEGAAPRSHEGRASPGVASGHGGVPRGSPPPGGRPGGCTPSAPGSWLEGGSEVGGLSYPGSELGFGGGDGAGDASSRPRTAPAGAGRPAQGLARVRLVRLEPVASGPPYASAGPAAPPAATAAPAGGLGTPPRAASPASAPPPAWPPLPPSPARLLEAGRFRRPLLHPRARAGDDDNSADALADADAADVAGRLLARSGWRRVPCARRQRDRLDAAAEATAALRERWEAGAIPVPAARRVGAEGGRAACAAAACILGPQDVVCLAGRGGRLSVHDLASGRALNSFCAATGAPWPEATRGSSTAPAIAAGPERGASPSLPSPPASTGYARAASPVASVSSQLWGGPGGWGGGGLSALFVANELESPLLLAGGAGGDVWVWRRAWERGQHRLAAAWRAVDHHPGYSGGASAAVFAWQGRTGHLMACVGPPPPTTSIDGGGFERSGGMCSVVHRWDVHVELASGAFDVGSEGAGVVTALGASGVTPAAMAAGTRGGRLLLFDARAGPRAVLGAGPYCRPAGDADAASASVASVSISALALEPGGCPGRLLAAVGGHRLQAWDLRAGLGPAGSGPGSGSGPLADVVAARRGGLLALAAHPDVPWVTTLAAGRVIKTWDAEGRLKGSLHGRGRGGASAAAAAAAAAAEEWPTALVCHPMRLEVAAGDPTEPGVSMIELAPVATPLIPTGAGA